MPYVSIEVEFESPALLYELIGPIEVLRVVLGVIDQSNLRGYNFNRYYDPNQNLPHPTIALRLNLDNPDQSIQAIHDALQRLVQEGKIRFFRLAPQPWQEPQFVVDAHEASTKCAMEFVDRITRDPALLRSLKEQPLEFMGHFVRALLQSMGLNAFITWANLRSPPPVGVDNLARACSAFVALNNQERKADFLERFLHTFLNCTIIGVEQPIITMLYTSDIWKNLASSEA